MLLWGKLHSPTGIKKMGPKTPAKEPSEDTLGSHPLQSITQPTDLCSPTRVSIAPFSYRYCFTVRRPTLSYPRSPNPQSVTRKDCRSHRVMSWKGLKTGPRPVAPAIWEGRIIAFKFGSYLACSMSYISDCAPHQDSVQYFDPSINQSARYQLQESIPTLTRAKIDYQLTATIRQLSLDPTRKPDPSIIDTHRNLTITLSDPIVKFHGPFPCTLIIS